jgi:hypothetical protein
MKPTIFYTLLLFLHVPVIAQLSESVQLPIIERPDRQVYISHNGDDNALGDSSSPVSSFSRALSIISDQTTALSGNLYSEIVFLPGTYYFPAVQPASHFQQGNRTLHVSLRGVGEVVLAGSDTAKSSSTAMIHLMGSKIYVKNIMVDYSIGAGVRFGLNGATQTILSNDVLIEDVTVRKSGSHGIIVGVGPVSTINPLQLLPKQERFHIKNCKVYESVNFNVPQDQWGSGIKTIHTRHTTIEGCEVYQCEGEGINADFAEWIDIRNNIVHDTKAGIYLDKAQNVMVRNNLVYFSGKRSAGFLMGLEAFSFLVTQFFMRNIFVYNNIFLNTPYAISLWQGTYGAFDNGTFNNIRIMHNTMIGKQNVAQGLVTFSYSTVLNQPASNTSLSGIEISRNILSANPDSLANGNGYVTAPSGGPHGTSGSYNLWQKMPSRLFNSSTDGISNQLPFSESATMLSALRPSTSNPAFIFEVPSISYITEDFNGQSRGINTTNAGAFEWTEISSSNLSRSKSMVKAYPNPSSGTFMLSWPEDVICEKVTLRIFDASGQNIRTERTTQLQSIRLDDAPSGMYFILLKEDCGGRQFALSLQKI